MFDYALCSLGHAWFDAVGPTNLGPFLKLFIHEVGHWTERNHLDENYHEALCDLGAKLTEFALAEPEVLRKWARGE
jgi:hypothetical protein